jgi:hypothetical protein
MLQGPDIEPKDAIFNNLWSIKAPSNMSMLAWKVLLDRVRSEDYG